MLAMGYRLERPYRAEGALSMRAPEDVAGIRVSKTVLPKAVSSQSELSNGSESGMSFQHSTGDNYTIPMCFCTF